MSDLVAYGAVCVWWDDKDNVAQLPSGLPCCPTCGGVLFEADKAAFMAAAQDFAPSPVLEEAGITYIEWLMWAQGKCYDNFTLSQRAMVDERNALIVNELRDGLPDDDGCPNDLP
jgi:hypothetical protein